jgi:hypothetical protein
MNTATETHNVSVDFGPGLVPLAGFPPVKLGSNPQPVHITF